MYRSANEALFTFSIYLQTIIGMYKVTVAPGELFSKVGGTAACRDDVLMMTDAVVCPVSLENRLSRWPRRLLGSRHIETRQ